MDQYVNTSAILSQIIANFYLYKHVPEHPNTLFPYMTDHKDVSTSKNLLIRQHSPEQQDKAWSHISCTEEPEA